MCVSHSHPPVDFVLLLTYLQALKLLNSHDDDDFKLRIIAIFRLIGYDDESSHQVSENWIYILQPLSRGSIARARRWMKREKSGCYKFDEKNLFFFNTTGVYYWFETTKTKIERWWRWRFAGFVSPPVAKLSINIFSVCCVLFECYFHVIQISNFVDVGDNGLRAAREREEIKVAGETSHFR